MAQIDAQFVGDDMGQRGLAEPWRAEDQHVVQCLAAGARGFDENPHLLAHGGLSDVVGEAFRADGAVHSVIVAVGSGSD